MPYTKAISPVSNSFLTKGKEYEIINQTVVPVFVNKHGLWFVIVDDLGDKINCLEFTCAHTNGISWQLK